MTIEGSSKRWDKEGLENKGMILGFSNMSVLEKYGFKVWGSIIEATLRIEWNNQLLMG